MRREIPEALFEDPGYRIKRLQAALRCRLDDALRSSGLTLAHLSVLNALRESPGLSNAELARLAFVKPQTMIGIVRSLERDSLIVRSPDPSHGRVKRTELADGGRAVLDLTRARMEKVSRDMLAGLSQKDVKQFLHFLDHCTQNMENNSSST